MPSRRLIDISQPVTATSSVWPGDTPFSFRWTWSLKGGDACNVSSVTSSPHVGTHADAPRHFLANGPSIGDVELERYCGPCWVLDGPRERHVETGDLEEIDLERYPRVLVRTRSHAHEGFPTAFTALTPGAAELLARRSAALVGLDTPSMDPFDSKELPAHKILSRAGVAILENLVLHHVAPGPYELLAFPLRWVGLDASPVRAVLRTLA